MLVWDTNTWNVLPPYKGTFFQQIFQNILGWFRETPIPRPQYLEFVLSTDGKYIYSWSRCGIVSAYERSTHACIKQRPTGMNDIIALTLSADGRCLYTSTSIGVDVWDTQTFQRQKTLPIVNVRVMVLSQNGQYLYTSSYNRRVQIWNTKTMECIVTLPTDNVDHIGYLYNYCGWLKTMTLSPDERFLYVGSIRYCSHICILDIVSCSRVMNDYNSYCPKLSSDGMKLVALEWDKDNTSIKFIVEHDTIDYVTHGWCQDWMDLLYLL